VAEGQRLFDRREDPHGLRDLSGVLPDEAARWRAEAERIQAALTARGEALGRAPSKPAGEGLVEELRALGYVE
jgi:hypothetical protein